MKTCYAVYRHFNKSGDLLYVGYTENVYARNMQHRSCSDWYKEIYNITLEHFDSKEEAQKAEINYIAKEKPIHNKLIMAPVDKKEQRELRNKKAFLWLNNEWRTPPYDEVSTQSLNDMVKMGIAEHRKSEKSYVGEFRLIQL
jgi:predicted GIY-YIG superfamily endonuclease